ncbi:glycosyltransferase family 2 protein [Jannaschia sp. LMIT008]|uniref:glycosyltransferase family 2 protein n=1 Tax=Jannaschia maritima TaxID=3032585 RepID=UPI0028112EFB|nr:glycosyltransferase [Jannaschia sp. LMIT008]
MPARARPEVPTLPATASPSIGLVAIGRNEGARLEACLTAAVAMLPPDRVVYVDSGSTDGSVAFAAGLGVRVVDLDVSGGFTAARARNAGADVLLAAADPPDLVQFVDGDCVLAPGWLGMGAAALARDRGLAVVAGRVREVAPDATIWNRLIDMEWDAPAGPADAVGGIALYRADAFRAVGGFDPGLICGEEPELCFRLRAAGWRVERLAAEMCGHDAAMTRLGQWLTRTRRTGWAFAEGADRMGASPERYNLRERNRILVWGGLVPALVLVLAAAALLLAFLGSARWWVPGGASLLGVLLYPAMALRVARGRMRDRGDPFGRAMVWALLVMGGKPWEMAGLLAYRRARRAGRRGALIEYRA